MANWFITGTSSGLGLALARAALARGDTVVGTVRAQADAQAFAALAPGRAHAMKLDVTDEAAVQVVVRTAQGLVGPLDYVVNNAGRGFTGAIEETSLEDARAFCGQRAGADGGDQGRAARHARAPGRAYRQRDLGFGAGGLARHRALRGDQVRARMPRADFGTGSGAAGDQGDQRGARRHAHGLCRHAPARRGTGDCRLCPDRPCRAGRLAGQARPRARLPERAAQAILTALDAPEPPLLLLLGEDALHYAEHEFAGLEAQIAQWKDLTLSIAAEPEVAGS
jgi:hypothetical protein